MATCNLCPPGSRDVPDAEMDGHLRMAHPEVGGEGTYETGGDTIVQDASLEPVAEREPGTGEWHRA
ncbi:hypothetical protein [Actinoplanes sp. URMC 104]|uniref:hypothetical protein n=1 Tax=Actinoplanes sp. URMC 104 TaxID=3423409 RepID=UPI003F197306